MQLKDVWVGGDDVWNFSFPYNHLVHFGDCIACSCSAERDRKNHLETLVTHCCDKIIGNNVPVEKETIPEELWIFLRDRKRGFCESLDFVVRHIWDLKDTSSITQLINPSKMVPFKCAICQNECSWKCRGKKLSFCVECLRVFHKNCLIRKSRASRDPCPLCNKQNFLPRGHSIHEVTETARV